MIDVSQVHLSGVIVTDAFKQTQLSAVEAGDLWAWSILGWDL